MNASRRSCNHPPIAAGSPKPELPVLQCAATADWERWLDAHHADSAGVWLKIAKQGSPTPTVGYGDSLDVAICHGWIDGQKRALDDDFWLQRFTPRARRSQWSQINRQKAIGLIEAGRMRDAGLTQIRAAQSDGRWDAAYEPQSRATVPPDLQRALDQAPAAGEFFASLTGARRYAFLYRLHRVQQPVKRAQRIAEYVVILSEGRTLN